MTPKEVLAQIRQREVTTVDLRFMDFPGVWQHFSIPADALTEDTFEEGIAFDGSSVVGWRAINEADLLVLPQPETALVDPFTAQPTLTMICNIHDPITQQDYTRDPRNIARKAVSYMRSTGLAERCLLAPELEFFIFDDVRFEQTGTRGILPCRFHGRGLEPRPVRASQPGLQGGFGSGLLPLPSHRQPGEPPVRDGPANGRMRHQDGGPLPRGRHRRPVRDRPQPARIWWKCRPGHAGADTSSATWPASSGKTATFMPKPLFGDNGSGMHTHLTLWKDDEPLLAGHGYAGLSDLGLYAIGGLLKHAPALCAFANPTTNSYKRLVEGFEAPTKFSYSRRNRAAIIRIPVSSPSPRSRRIEYPLPRQRGQSLSAVLRHADGRARRHPEQDPPRRPARQGHLRPSARGTGERTHHPALTGRLA